MEVNIKPPHRIIDKYVGIDGNGNFGLRRLVSTTDCNVEKYGATADTVIHPNTIHDVTAVVVTVKEGIPVEDAKIDYIITAEDIRLIKEHVVIDGAELQRIMLQNKTRKSGNTVNNIILEHTQY